MKNILEGPEALSSSGDLLPSTSVWKECIQYVMFFTLMAKTVASHFTKDGNRRYLCLGDGCPACAGGERSTQHTLLPIWNVKFRRVEILQLQMTSRGPLARVKEFLQKYKSDLANIVAKIESRGNGEVAITALAARPDTDRGAAICQMFGAQLESETFKLTDCFSTLTAEEIRRLPEVAGLNLETLDSANDLGLQVFSTSTESLAQGTVPNGSDA